MSKTESIKFSKDNVLLEKDHLTHTSATDFPGSYPDEDDAFDFEEFKKKLHIEITKKEGNELEFDLAGVDASFANAIRRILLSEVPSIAIEHVLVHNNTSVIQDEVLAHRMGLVPLNIDHNSLSWRTDGEAMTAENTIVFELRVKCESNPNAKTPTQHHHAHVFSKDLVWIPQGDQAKLFANSPPKPIHDDILLAKLRPGQEIFLELHCIKGIGKEHAKWSPVATTSYRLMPNIILHKEFYDDDADKLASLFSPGVMKIEKDAKGRRKCVVDNARNDSMSREVLRHAEFQEFVTLSRKRNHFLFSIESTGSQTPEQLMHEAIGVLISKCNEVKRVLNNMDEGESEESSSQVEMQS